MTTSRDAEQRIAGIAALDLAVRRGLYRVLSDADGAWLSRDEAADALAITRSLAAFHLDKLVEADLLQATFRRLGGRRGPGAGRPSKLYRRSSTQLDVSLPPRRYELAAHVLAQALGKSAPESAHEALRNSAREWGKRLAGETPDAGGRGQPLKRAERALEACGFEPQRTTDAEGEVVLRNCPFDSLKSESRDLICGMNLALIEGLIDGLGLEGVRATLRPRPGFCCVTLKKSGTGE